MNAINNELNNSATQNSLFDNHLQSAGSKQHTYSMSPLVTGGGLTEVTRLRDELQNKNAQINNIEEQILQANKACEVWKNEAEENNRKVNIKFEFDDFIK